MSWFFNSSDLPSYGSNSRKGYTLRLLSMCQENERGRALEVFPTGSGQVTYFGGRKGLHGGLRTKMHVSKHVWKTFLEELA